MAAYGFTRGKRWFGWVASGLALASGCKENADERTRARDAGEERETATTCQGCEPDEVCVSGVCSEPGAAALETSLGSGPGELGVLVPAEAAAVAPMSLAVRGDGMVWILDQENERLQLFSDNAVVKELPLDSGTYQDLVLLDDGRLVLIDRLVASELVVLTDEGKVQSRLPLYGKGLDQPSAAGNLEVRPDGVWVPYRRHMVRLLDEHGEAPEERELVWGHLSKDGRSVISVKWRKNLLNIFKRNRVGRLESKEANHDLERDISTVSETHTDAAGNLYLLVSHFGNEADPQRFLMVFDEELKPVRTHEILPEEGSAGGEVFREFDVTATGDVYMLRMAGEGALVRRY